MYWCELRDLLSKKSQKGFKKTNVLDLSDVSVLCYTQDAQDWHLLNASSTLSKNFSMPLALQISDLKKEYLPGKSVLHSLDYSVEVGSFSAFLGANGAGKSTTLGII